MKFLIAGFGSIGRRHFRNLLALGQGDILFLRSNRSTLPEDEIADFPVEFDLSSALDHNPDAVIVSNPTALHLDVAIPAAEAGCHLFLEKPISHSMAGVDQLRAALKRGGGRSLVGFQFRFHPGLEKISQLLSAGAIGKPLSARAHWGEYLPDWHPWEDYRQGYSARKDLGGGVVLTLCHPLDYLRWLLGRVKDLWAFTGQISELELQVEDHAEIGLRFASGALASVHLDYNQRPPCHHLVIAGTQGTVRWDSADGAVHVYSASTGTWQVYPAPEGFKRNDMFRDQMAHFLAVVRGDQTPRCTLEDGIWALKLALATHEASRLGQVVTWEQ
jgi:predicted dehydrogenase